MCKFYESTLNNAEIRFRIDNFAKHDKKVFNVTIFLSFSMSIKTGQFCWEELCALLKTEVINIV